MTKMRKVNCVHDGIVHYTRDEAGNWTKITNEFEINKETSLARVLEEDYQAMLHKPSLDCFNIKIILTTSGGG